MDRYNLHFNPRVNEELVGHAAFIARVSYLAAERLYQEFQDVLKRLTENPYQFPPFEHPNLPADAYRKARFAKWYLLVFSVEDSEVWIDAVLNGRGKPINYQ